MDHATFKELWRNGKLTEVYEEIDDGWRHGNDMYTVYQHGDDFWAASYRVTGDGEEHGIRNGDFELTKVYPITKTVVTTDYVNTPQKPKPPTRYRRKYHEVEASQFPGLPGIDAMDAFDQEFDELEKFEAWINVNKGDLEVIYRGGDLVLKYDSIFEDVVPPGHWIIKEGGRSIYPMAPDDFSNHFEKA